MSPDEAVAMLAGIMKTTAQEKQAIKQAMLPILNGRNPVTAMAALVELTKECGDIIVRAAPVGDMRNMRKGVDLFWERMLDFQDRMRRQGDQSSSIILPPGHA